MARKVKVFWEELGEVVTIIKIAAVKKKVNKIKRKKKTKVELNRGG